MVTETYRVNQKPAFKKVHVIANPAAGKDEPILGVLNRAFKGAGIDWDMFLTKEAGDAQRLAQEAAQAGADLVAVYGGDGSVMEVASGLIGTGLPLAILPGGTANVMSVELGIPGDLPSAVSLICGDGHTIRAVDMGRVRDQLFILRITTGLSAEMTKNTEREDKNRLGVLAYALSWLRAVPTTPASRYQLTLDGEQVELEGVTCVIANSASLGLPGLTLAKTADISDGLLDVFVFRSTAVNELLSIAANAVIDADLIPHWQVREATVVADPPQTVECDGEVLDPTPLTARIVPQAVRVVVPITSPLQAETN
jgi:YegS/Rv2252/BmrU family lipid kinase